MEDQPMKLTEYMFASEQCEEAEKAIRFLCAILGTYECERNTTVKFLEGYIAAMKRIIRQAEL